MAVLDCVALSDEAYAALVAYAGVVKAPVERLAQTLMERAVLEMARGTEWWVELSQLHELIPMSKRSLVDRPPRSDG